MDDGAADVVMSWGVPPIMLRRGAQPLKYTRSAARMSRICVAQRGHAITWLARIAATLVRCEMWYTADVGDLGCASSGGYEVCSCIECLPQSVCRAAPRWFV